MAINLITQVDAYSGLVSRLIFIESESRVITC